MIRIKLTIPPNTPETVVKMPPVASERVVLKESTTLFIEKSEKAPPKDVCNGFQRFALSTYFGRVSRIPRTSFMNVGKKKYKPPASTKPRERNTRTTAKTLGTPFFMRVLFIGSIAEAIVTAVSTTRTISRKRYTK